MENRKENAINLMRLSRVLNTIASEVKNEIESVHSTFKKEDWSEVLSIVNNNNVNIKKIRNNIARQLV